MLARVVMVLYEHSASAPESLIYRGDEVRVKDEPPAPLICVFGTEINGKISY
jgi:hypothetical protein